MLTRRAKAYSSSSSVV